MAGKKAAADLKIKRREDAMMVAAAIVYSGTKEFPYETEFGSGMVETEIASISNITLTRKEQHE